MTRSSVFFSGQLPNIVGLTCGTVQMVLYAMYRNNKPVKDQKLPEHKGDINNNNENVEKHEEVKDIEMGEKNEEKEEKKEEKEEKEEKDQKKQDHEQNQTELNIKDEDKNDDNNNKKDLIRERESCEVWWEINIGHLLVAQLII